MNNIFKMYSCLLFKKIVELNLMLYGVLVKNDKRRYNLCQALM